MNGAIIDVTDSMDEISLMCAADRLTNALDEINSDGNEYRSVGQDVGWQNHSGRTAVELDDGNDLLRKITPSSPWRIEAKVEDDALHITLFHHDSPTGETHVLTAAR